ncbi:hypothetical protein [Ottowia thiooxydans]|uniref:Uncharacterized protein n=1 Tax=Ottowia thiooxydans TaxID=219182 RepID=A0ABV2QBF6_9BURK
MQLANLANAQSLNSTLLLNNIAELGSALHSIGKNVNGQLFSTGNTGDTPRLLNQEFAFNVTASTPLSFKSSEYLDDTTTKELGKIWESIDGLKSRVSDLENMKAGTPSQLSQFIDQLPIQANRFIASASEQFTSLVGENLPSRLAALVQSLPGLTYDIFQNAGARITEVTGKEVPSQVSGFFGQLPEWTSGFFTSVHLSETTASVKQFAGQISTYACQVFELLKTAYAHMPEVKFEDFTTGALALKDQLMQSTMSLVAQGDALLKEYAGDKNASFVISTSVAIGIAVIATFAASFVAGA